MQFYKQNLFSVSLRIFSGKLASLKFVEMRQFPFNNFNNFYLKKVKLMAFSDISHVISMFLLKPVMIFRSLLFTCFLSK